MVQIHPVSGRKFLFVNEGFTQHLVGLGATESNRLLAYLYQHMQRPEYQVRFRWSKEAMAIWDNRCTCHYATADYLPQERVMTESDRAQPPGLRVVGLGEPQMLADDHLIENRFDANMSSANVPHVYHAPHRRIEPVIVADKPWEQGAPGYGTVHYDPEAKLFKMWYQTWKKVPKGAVSEGNLYLATSRDGVTFDYFKQTPVLHADDGGGGRKGVYRPGFVGFLGRMPQGTPRYLVAWQESQPFDGDPRLIYGYTSDFKSITRDPRGHVRWKGSDGSISAWREADRLFLFSGKHVHEIRLPIKPRG